MTVFLGVASSSPRAAIPPDRLSMTERAPSRPLDAILISILWYAYFYRSGVPRPRTGARKVAAAANSSSAISSVMNVLLHHHTVSMDLA